MGAGLLATVVALGLYLDGLAAPNDGATYNSARRHSEL